MSVGQAVRKSACLENSLFAKIESLKELVVLVKIVLFQVVEQLASPASHSD